MSDTEAREGLPPFVCDDHAWWSMTIPCPSCEANDETYFGPTKVPSEDQSR